MGKPGHLVARSAASTRDYCRYWRIRNQLGADVEGIAAWWAAQPRWWMKFWNTIGHVDSPVGLVDESVVAAAEGNAVVDAGGSVVSPVHGLRPVLGEPLLGPHHRPLACRERCDSV